MTLWRNRHCENCKHYSNEYDNAGICPQLGVINKRGEFIVDGEDIFKKLGIKGIEYRHPIVRRGFGCTYWKERKL
jgi:hypothetical protein